jgi:uncharacterized protein (TIGR00299 family) protein
MTNSSTLYLDCFSGISGDMFLGAMMDLGFKPSTLEWELQKLNLKEPFHLHVSRETRKGIQGVRFEVHEGKTHSEKCDHDHSHEHHHDEPHHHHCCEHDHEHEHHHHDHHCCEHDHDDEHCHEEHHHNHRSHADIVKMIESSGLSEYVKKHSLSIFEHIAKAEAKIHGMKVTDVHFHEVGALDSIIDIIGTCVAMETLQIKKVLASPLVEGQGWIHCAHGKYPIPAPATLEILSGIPLTQTNVPHELITPTGAAILREFVEHFGVMESLSIVKVGYGVGSRDLKDRPNALRAALVQESAASTSAFERDEVVVLETNLDDITGEQLGHAQELLLQNGALDVTIIPVQMKKNRPGIQLQVIAPVEKLKSIAELIVTHTSAFGLRYQALPRLKLRKEEKTVTTPYGSIRLKLGYLGDKLLHSAPEYEDCKKAAEKHQLSLSEIMSSIKL